MVIYVQWRRLSRARGHVPPTFTNSWHGGTVSRRTANKKLTITKALTKTNNFTRRAKKLLERKTCFLRFADKSYLSTTCAPHFNFVPAPLCVSVIKSLESAGWFCCVFLAFLGKIFGANNLRKMHRLPQDFSGGSRILGGGWLWELDENWGVLGLLDNFMHLRIRTLA